MKTYAQCEECGQHTENPKLYNNQWLCRIHYQEKVDALKTTQNPELEEELRKLIDATNSAKSSIW